MTSNRSSRRRDRRIEIGTTALAAIAVVWIVVAALTGSPEPIPTADFVEWTHNRERVIAAGPGGFVRFGPNQNLQFSAGGEEWARVELPILDGEENKPHYYRTRIVSSDDMWVVTEDVDEAPRRWSSPNGTDWTRIDIDPDVELLGGGGPGFLARVGNEYVWSTDVRQWSPMDGQTFRRRKVNDAQFFGTRNGAAVVVNGYREPAAVMVTDGAQWVSSTLDHRSEAEWMQVLDIERVADRWIALGVIYDEDEVRRALVWSSSDGETWEFVAQPDVVGGDARVADGRFGIGPWPTLEVARVGGRGVYELWLTTDGTEWVRALSADRIDSYALLDNGDGTYRGVYSGSKPPSEDS